MLNVHEFGAIGDGLTDDTAAIQSALNALPGPFADGFAEGGTVFLPIGKYKISSTLTINTSNVTLLGAGGGASRLVPTSTFTGTDIIAAGPASGVALFLRNLVLQDFGIDGTNPTNKIAFHLGSVRNGTALVRLRVDNHDGAFCVIDKSTVGSALISEGVSAYDCYFTSKTPEQRDGITIIGANEIQFVGCKIISTAAVASTKSGIVVKNDSRGFRLPGCSVAHYSVGVLLTGDAGQSSGTECTISGCTFESNTTAIGLNGVDASHMSQSNAVLGNRYLGTFTTMVNVDFCQDSIIIEPSTSGGANAVNFTANSARNFLIRRFGSSTLGDVSTVGTDNVVLGPVFGALVLRNRGFFHASATPTWGTSVAIDVRLANTFLVNGTTNIAAVIAAPSNAPPALGAAEQITIIIFNNTGGAFSTPPSFASGSGAYRSSGSVNPASGKRIAGTFEFDQAANLWVEISRGAAV